MTRLAGIVLAAGEGRRMGGTKALIELEGASLVEHHVSRLAEIGCTSIVVVARHTAADVVRSVVGRSREVRVEGVTTNSQAASLAAGLRVLDAAGSAHDDVIIVTPVDMLPASSETHRALLACLDGSIVAVTPLHAGRGGHPVILRRQLLAPYEAARDDEPPSLRDVLAGAMESRRRVEVDDPRVLGDLDTPADLRALRGGAEERDVAPGGASAHRLSKETRSSDV
ncbi:MAG: NTP transferase domain-containing protein [Polyangiaceae bacterium]